MEKEKTMKILGKPAKGTWKRVELVHDEVIVIDELSRMTVAQALKMVETE